MLGIFSAREKACKCSQKNMTSLSLLYCQQLFAVIEEERYLSLKVAETLKMILKIL